jgi:hypothetical protein
MKVWDRLWPWMLATLLACLIGATLCTGGCTPSTANAITRDATVSANATATSLETVQSLLLVYYRAEQEIAVQQAPSKDDAKARVTKIRAAWVPVWDACDKARHAYAVLVALLSSTGASSVAIQSAVTDQSARMQAVLDQLSLARTRAQQVMQ